MSCNSYAIGFCKKAAEHGVDPHALAEFIKESQAGGVWDSVKNVIDQIKQKWDKVDPDSKPLIGSLIGAGGGALGGALTGKLTGWGAGKGALAGAGLGGVGGALYGADYGSNQQRLKAIQRLIDQKQKFNDQQRKHQELLDTTMEGYTRTLQSLWSSKKKNAAQAKAIESLNKSLTEANSKADELQIIKNNLEGFDKLTPAQQNKVVAELMSARDRVGKDLAYITAMRSPLAVNAKPDAKATEWFKNRLKNRIDLAWRKVMRDADRKIENANKKPQREAPYFDFDMGSIRR